MQAIEHFKFCPRCGEQTRSKQVPPAFRCDRCQFVYFFNPCTAAAAFIVNARDEALFIRRAKEPAQGKLALPGGFVDADETAEVAVRREIREEVNVEIASLDYLCSQPNEYHYREVTYQVLDFFFVAVAQANSKAAALDGVESYCWLRPAQVDLAEIAFPSIRAALAVYNGRYGRRFS